MVRLIGALTLAVNADEGLYLDHMRQDNKLFTDLTTPTCPEKIGRWLTTGAR